LLQRSVGQWGSIDWYRVHFEAAVSYDETSHTGQQSVDVPHVLGVTDGTYKLHFGGGQDARIVRYNWITLPGRAQVPAQEFSYGVHVRSYGNRFCVHEAFYGV